MALASRGQIETRGLILSHVLVVVYLGNIAWALARGQGPGAILITSQPNSIRKARPKAIADEHQRVRNQIKTVSRWPGNSAQGVLHISPRDAAADKRAKRSLDLSHADDEAARPRRTHMCALAADSLTQQTVHLLDGPWSARSGAHRQRRAGTTQSWPHPSQRAVTRCARAEAVAAADACAMTRGVAVAEKTQKARSMLMPLTSDMRTSGRAARAAWELSRVPTHLEHGRAWRPSVAGAPRA